MSKVTKNDRIAHLELQVTWLTDAVHELQGTENIEGEPQLKTLDQSVFDGLDEKWRFAAVNATGRLMLSKTKMVHDNKYWWASSKSSDLASGYDGYDASDWQNSIIERDKVELIGSDLCRAMLERGDKLVMCAVSDDGE